jgi:hypothetical protein
VCGGLAARDRRAGRGRLVVRDPSNVTGTPGAQSCRDRVGFAPPRADEPAAARTGFPPGAGPERRSVRHSRVALLGRIQL